MVTSIFMQIRMKSHSLKFNDETVNIRLKLLNMLKHIINISNKLCFKSVIHNIMKCIITCQLVKLSDGYFTRPSDS
jgi:hypothetical protein